MLFRERDPQLALWATGIAVGFADFEAKPGSAKSYLGNLRMLSILFALYFGCASITAQPLPPKPVLELGVDLLSQSYCATNGESTSLAMDLRLRYTNRSTQKIILYKGHDLFYQTRVRKAAHGTAEAYDVLYINSRYFDEELEEIDRPTPGRVFVTLAPGEAYQRNMTIGIAVVGESVDRGNNSIRNGEHTLQLIVSSWYKTWPLGHKLREQWRAKGFLWLDPVVSSPVRFVAERPQSLPTCK